MQKLSWDTALFFFSFFFCSFFFFLFCGVVVRRGSVGAGWGKGGKLLFQPVVPESAKWTEPLRQGRSGRKSQKREDSLACWEVDPSAVLAVHPHRRLK